MAWLSHYKPAHRNQLPCKLSGLAVARQDVGMIPLDEPGMLPLMIVGIADIVAGAGMLTGAVGLRLAYGSYTHIPRLQLPLSQDLPIIMSCYHLIYSLY